MTDSATVCVPTGRLRRAELALKRVLDLSGAVVGLVVSGPLMICIALLLRCTSQGPIFYRWNVVGRYGRPFTGYKFRTMVANADALKRELAASNEMSGPVFKLRNDPRVTPLGRILRRSSLDELPQLWSVLTGDMSLVGPRPPLQTEYEGFTERQKRKLSVKPGITCLWQIRGRSNITDFEEWLRLDMEYIENWSLALDLKILLETVPAVLTARGAR